MVWPTPPPRRALGVSGMVTVIDMILTGVEALIMFVINYFVGTYICLTSALIPVFAVIMSRGLGH